GGDGFVVARHLLVRGARPLVVLAGDAARTSGDARANLDAWRGLGGELREIAPGAAGAALEPLRAALGEAEVVVDALFGTGLDRPIDGWLADVVRAMNAVRVPRFAVDLPSGLDADTGRTLGVAVHAQVTVTFAHPKLGLLTPGGARLAGRLHVADIGVPASLVEHPQVGHAARVMETADLAAWRAPRPADAHKTSAGHVLVVAGSPGRIGAALLVARGAMRAGAGLATIATWPQSAAAIESRVLEVMTARIDPAAAEASLRDALGGKRAVVVGPGFGLGADARAAVEAVIAAWDGPLVVDADALTLFAGRAAALRAAKQAILTPHPGEAGRLLGASADEVERDRWKAARELAATTGAVVVLKGAHTIVAPPPGDSSQDPQTLPVVSPVACAALATAGSGDVLGGVIAAFACSLDRFPAACAGVLAHGLSGAAWSASHGGADRGMIAPEIADGIPGLA
ncbi:MAG TPA: NAD(P)H-hydrate dehydratase, partial [Polyangiaceae bacterium]|nr:NAD(P)H-hydrate dehydratase [Polyangiaceae bacterium]